MGNRILQDYGVMPQAKGNKESFVDFMQRTTWFQAMTTALQRHSEFMRPELGDFPDMEYGYPHTPNQGPWLPSDQEDGSDLSPGGGACVLSCYAPLYCDQPVKCHFSLSQTPPGMTPTEGLQNVQMTVTETVAYPTKQIRRVSGDRMSMQSHQTDSVMDSIYRTQNSGEGGPGGGPSGRAKSLARPKAGSIFPIEIWPPSTGWPNWPDQPMTKLKICVQDPAGNICCTKLNVFCRIPDCCQAPSYIAMTFDDASTADTIAPGGSITVYVLNGCGPYNWTVSGAGYSFAVGNTSSTSNTLSLAAGACGSGVGGAGPVGTVTITDDCGTSVVAKIRSTAGAWAMTCSLQVSGREVNDSICVANGTTSFIFYYIDAATRWRVACVSSSGAYCAKNTSTPYWSPSTGSCPTASPPCGSPLQCATAHGGSCVPTYYPYSCTDVALVSVGGAGYHAASVEIWVCP